MERPTDKDTAIVYIPTTKLKIMEKWRDIEGYEGLYQVSSEGRVKSLGNNKTRKEKILKSGKVNNGYFYVVLCKEGKTKNFKVHRLVASAFIDNPNNLFEVNHKDEDKTNNRVDNLEWCDRKYNNNYGTRIERFIKSKSIPILQFSRTGELVRKWNSAKEVERELKLNQSNISSCCNGKQKTCGGYKWHYHYKSLWLKNHIPQIKLKKVT